MYTVLDLGWNGVKNGQLVQLMIKQNFDALLTFDKNLQHQQNFQKHPLTVFVLSASNNTYFELTKLSGRVNNYLDKGNLPAGPIIISVSKADI